jgi:hypothetical protein
MGAAASKAAAAAITAVLVMTAGCGGKDGKDGDGKAVPAEGKATHTARPVVDAPSLTQAQLESAEVTAAELPGWTTEPAVGKGGYARTVQDPAKRPQASPAACRPLYAVTDQLTGGWGAFTGSAAEWVRADSPELGEHQVLLNLRSYATAADADRVVSDVRTALADCRGQFGVPEQRWTFGSTRQLPDPAAGDDALAYRTVQTLAGDDPKDVDAPGHGLYHVVVVRCGATVATFSEFAMDGDPAAVPMPVVTAQSAKLAKSRA